MARISRPPGFDMTYKPTESTSFGPPAKEHLGAIVYLVLALSVVCMVVVGTLSPSGSWLFHYVVEVDPQRVLGARPVAVILLLSAVASVLRARMRGVIVRPEGVEFRDSLAGGWPRVRKYAWPQIDKIVLDGGASIALELWDGRREWLPAVGARDRLAATLERVAVARAIPISGGTGMFDELAEDD
jgi:hypothetical protein